MRKTSSLTRCDASPTKRIRPSIRSLLPWKGSYNAPSGVIDIALKVKSRRAASSSQSVPNSTTACRPSVSTSRRNVVTSNFRPAITAVIVPCSTPVGTTLILAFANRAMTCSGRASVARSISRTDLLRTKSRTQPPTNRTSAPSAVKASIRAAVSGGGLKAVGFAAPDICLFCEAARDPLAVLETGRLILARVRVAANKGAGQ